MPTFSFAKPIDDIEDAVVLEEDWRRARIAKAPTIEPNKKKQSDPDQEGAGDNLVVSLALAGGEGTGRRFKLYLPWPSAADEDLYDGIGMKVSDAKMERIADFTVKFGGISDGTDIMLEEGMEGFVYVTRGLDQSGQRMVNSVDPFAGFKSVEDFTEEVRFPPLRSEKDEAL